MPELELSQAVDKAIIDLITYRPDIEKLDDYLAHIIKRIVDKTSEVTGVNFKWSLKFEIKRSKE